MHRTTMDGPTPHGGPRRVLVAEDSATQRRLLRRILERADFEVCEAVDGLDAITRCALDRPAVALLDVDMPGCDGLTVLRRLKGDPALADIQVVMLTAERSPATAAAGLAAGAADYVRKPCHPAELVERVRRALAGRQAIDDLRRRTATDELTGLPNRRGMESFLAGVGAHGSAGVGLLVVDVDHFKAVNDRWGHGVGDVVLRTVAARLARAWPPFAVARWGGEEFLAAGPATALDELVEVAERFRSAVGVHPIVVPGDLPPLPVTVSVGAVLVDREGLDAGAVDAADRALYEAKESGRDRVVAVDRRAVNT